MEKAEGGNEGHGASSADSDLPIPPGLRLKLEDFQRKLWSVKIAEGALAGLVGLTLSYLAIFAVDRFVDTPFLVRLSFLILGFAVPAIAIPLRWYRWVSKQRTLDQIARLLKRRFPRLGDELLGIVELSRSPTGTNSPELVRAAMKQVEIRLLDRDFDEAVPARNYGSWLVAALSLLALSCLLLFLVNRAAGNALERWISPWKSVDRYTFATVNSVPDAMVVPYAEPFSLSPEIESSSEWKPDTATVRLPGKTKLSAPRVQKAYPFELPPQKEDGDLKLRVGDDRREISVRPLPRPELTGLSATLRLPDYLRYVNDPTVTVRSGTLPVVRGASATLTGTASRDLAQVEAEGVNTHIEGSTFSTDPIEVSDTVEKSIRWSDVHGLEAKAPLQIRLEPVEDEGPDVFARQVGSERIVLADEVVSFDLAATDDFGVKSIGLEWIGVGVSDEATKGEKPVAAGNPEETRVETRATFSAARENVPAQTLQLRAFAEDYLPDRPRSYSPAFLIHVMSPTDHAEWLTQEFGKWFRNAREVYEREQQLHESNRALRELSAAELDSPENRRRLEEQSSAETNNGRRLENLTESGRDLVRQATKNDEFDADRLESWASMMRSLEDISKQRMPAVADKLRKASRAEGAGSPSSSSSEDKQSPGREETKDPSSDPNSATPPDLTDTESRIDDGVEGIPGENKPKTGSQEGPVRLPSTTLGPAPDSESGSGKAGTPSPAQEKLDDAIEEQEDLLAAFAEITDQLQQILASLEASTFVKRLKSASRRQAEIATNLNQLLGSGFGLPKNRIEQANRDAGKAAATEQEEQSTLVYEIQTDLEAYYQRKQDEIYKSVLDQMKSSSVVSRLKEVGRESRVNLTGRAIAASQYWADTFDRWAEELVSASESDSESNQEGSSESLPPEIVLEIMKVLQEEMYLRDETREMESTRPILPPDIYESKVRPLETTQADLRSRIDNVVVDIGEMEDSAKHFAKELQLLNLVSDIMRQSRAVLSRPDTGPEAIAAQTEAIELLLQSKRQKNDGGGGGAGSNPGGGGAAGGKGSALSDVQPGPAGQGESAPSERQVDQATGKAGRELPEEFRRGLDQYFNSLESNR